MSQSMFDAVEQFFRDLKWVVSPTRNKGIIEIRYSGQAGNWLCIARVREEQKQFMFYSILPDKIPESRRHELAILITYINYGLLIGNFEMDMDDGEVRFKTGIELKNPQLNSELIRPVVEKNIRAMEEYTLMLNEATANPDTIENFVKGIRVRNSGG